MTLFKYLYVTWHPLSPYREGWWVQMGGGVRGVMGRDPELEGPVAIPSLLRSSIPNVTFPVCENQIAPGRQNIKNVIKISVYI